MSATTDFYLTRADQSAEDARTTDLPHVRERCLRAEAAWRAMADRLLKNETLREQQAEEKASRMEQGL
ncbi:MAG: hypothetical protein AB7E60_14780 [Sphingobium sp.]